MYACMEYFGMRLCPTQCPRLSKQVPETQCRVAYLCPSAISYGTRLSSYTESYPLNLANTQPLQLYPRISRHLILTADMIRTVRTTYRNNLVTGFACNILWMESGFSMRASANIYLHCIEYLLLNNKFLCDISRRKCLILPVCLSKDSIHN